MRRNLNVIRDRSATTSLLSTAVIACCKNCGGQHVEPDISQSAQAGYAISRVEKYVVQSAMFFPSLFGAP